METKTWADLIRKIGDAVVVAQVARIPSMRGKFPSVISMVKRGARLQVDAVGWCAWEKPTLHVSVCAAFTQSTLSQFPSVIEKIPGWNNPASGWRWHDISECHFWGQVLNLPIETMVGMEDICMPEVMAGITKKGGFLSSVPIPHHDGGHYTLAAFKMSAKNDDIPLLAALIDMWMAQSRKNEEWTVWLHVHQEGHQINTVAIRIIVGETGVVNSLVTYGSPFVVIPSVTDTRGQEAAQKIGNSAVVRVGEEKAGLIYAFVKELANRPGVQVTLERANKILSPNLPVVHVARGLIEVCQRTIGRHINFAGLLGEGLE